MMTNRKINYQITAENKTNKAFASVRKSIGGLAKVGAVAGAAFGAAVIASYAKAAKSIDKLAKSSTAIGIPTDQLASLQYQAELSGVSIESLDSSMLRFTKRMGEAEQGVGAASKTIEQLGLDTSKFFNLQPAEQYKIVADKIAGMSSAQEKAAVSAALFGREGLMMVNMLNSGSQGFAEAAKEAELFGLNVSKIDAAKIEAANDSMTRVKSIFTGVTNQIAIQFAPVVGALANLFVDATKSAGGVGPVVKTMSEKATKALGFLADMGRGLSVVFLGIRQAFAEVINIIVSGIGKIAGFGGNIAEKLGFDAEGLKSINSFADSFSRTTDKMAKELNDKILEPMPSSKIKTYVDDFSTKFEEQVRSNQGKLKINPLPEEEKASNVVKFKPKNTAKDDAEGEIKEYFDNVVEFAKSNEQIVAASASSTFASIADATKNAKGEQSKLYRAMFAASKAFAVAEASIAVVQAVSNAAKSKTYPENLIAMATVGAKTAGLVSTIKGTQMASFEGGGYTGDGIRAGGVDGKGGKMAVLHPNETVTDNTKSGGPNIVVNNYSGQAVDVITRDDVTEIVIGQMGDSTSRSRKALHATSNVQAKAS